MSKIPVSVILITKDEGSHLAETLECLKDFKEIVVVDSESQDRTREIARTYGARVFTRPFDDFAMQKNYALEKTTQDWVFSIDADEIPNGVLISSIGNAACQTSTQEGAYRVLRKNIHFGRELKYGGQGNDFPIRVFRKDRARFVGRVHEIAKVHGKVGRLSGELIHKSSRSINEYLQKLALYPKLEAQILKEKGKKPSVWEWGLKPAVRFFYTYILRFGFLDGYEGFIFHALSSFYHVLKEASLELELPCRSK